MKLKAATDNFKNYALGSVKEYSFAYLALLIVIVLTGFLATTGDNVRSSELIDNSTQLEHINDNKIGSVILRNTRPYPVLYQPKQLKACVYTSNNRTPLILDIEKEDYLLMQGNEVRNIDVNISIPENKLSWPRIDQELTIEKHRRCPTRSSPKMVLVEK